MEDGLSFQLYRHFYYKQFTLLALLVLERHVTSFVICILLNIRKLSSQKFKCKRRNRVWKGILRIRDLTKIWCGIWENAKYLDGTQDLTATREAGFAKIWARDEGLACVSRIQEIVTTQTNVLAAKVNQPGEQDTGSSRKRSGNAGSGPSFQTLKKAGVSLGEGGAPGFINTVMVKAWFSYAAELPAT